MNRSEVFDLINDERGRQKLKWAAPHAWGKGDCSSNDVEEIVKVAVLGEEFGEVARAVLDNQTTNQLRAELVQCAAVCVAWLESI